MWRLAVPVIVAAFWLSGVRLPGWAALLLTAGLLAISLGAQFALARFRRYEIAVSTEHLGPFWRERGKASRWFLIGTVLDSAALNMDIIFVGLLVAPSVAGVYFNAFRTAGLLTLFMFAITIVVAPMVAHHFHAGEMRKAQAITALCAWAGFLFSLVVFVGFLLFGDQVMSLFGGSHEQGALLLVILSVGLLFDAATGPSRIMLMMTGHERAYVRIFGAVIVVAMIVQIPVILAYGAVGAAVVNTLGRIGAQLGIAIYARRKVGLDSTLLGAFLVNRQTDRLA
jgi:O-antigen/teichoic acid export membrane protein